MARSWGFILPSAVMLYALAASSGHLTGPWGQAIAHGLKWVAVAVVSAARQLVVALIARRELKKLAGL